MIKSMTGFGSIDSSDPLLGKLHMEVRSLNHRFLEIIFNLPEGFAYAHDKIKAEIENIIKRGRVTVTLNMGGRPRHKAVFNKELLREYARALRGINKEFSLSGEVSLDVLLHLPGVLRLEEEQEASGKAWQTLQQLLNKALAALEKNRQKAGRAIYAELMARSEKLQSKVAGIRGRAKVAIAQKAAGISGDEEKASFLKSSDITEELTLLIFHLKSFRATLHKSVPVGKEMDFIAQEMQREINTLAAKSFDTRVIAVAVDIKTQIEKIREQVQNVE